MAYWDFSQKRVEKLVFALKRCPLGATEILLLSLSQHMSQRDGFSVQTREAGSARGHREPG